MVVYSVMLFILAALTIAVETVSLLGGGRAPTAFEPPIEVSPDFDLNGYNLAQNIVRLCMSAPLIICGVLLLIQPAIPVALIGIAVLILGVIGGFVAHCLVLKHFKGRFWQGGGNPHGGLPQ